MSLDSERSIDSRGHVELQNMGGPFLLRAVSEGERTLCPRLHRRNRRFPCHCRRPRKCSASLLTGMTGWSSRGCSARTTRSSSSTGSWCGRCPRSRSILRDRGEKREIYARAGIPAYWIINLVDRQLESHSRPTGGAYPPPTVLGVADS